MKRIYIGSLLALAIFFANAWWRYSTNQPSIFQRFPDSVVPRQVFPSDALTIFNDSQDITIYVVSESEKYRDKKLDFHGYAIVEQAKLNASQIANLRTAFLENAKRQGFPALCFFPQHGIRMEHKGQILDFLICLHCGHIYTYFNGKETREAFSSRGLQEFNALWNSAGLSPEKLPFPP